jgi:hypothetical protein
MQRGYISHATEKFGHTPTQEFKATNLQCIGHHQRILVCVYIYIYIYHI